MKIFYLGHFTVQLQTYYCYLLVLIYCYMPSTGSYYCQTQKTVNTWKISGMLIVYWPITIKFRIRLQSSKPQTNYRCCLLFSYLVPYWLISCNTITFHKYFWCSWFCEFHSNIIILLLLYHQTGKTGTPEIFLECYCVAIKKAIRHEKTKPQARMLISLFFCGLLACPDLRCDCLTQ